MDQGDTDPFYIWAAHAPADGGRAKSCDFDPWSRVELCSNTGEDDVSIGPMLTAGRRGNIDHISDKLLPFCP